MPAYEGGDFEPPAPVVRALVLGPTNIAYRNVPLLLDTGADVSVIPLDVAEAVGAEIHDSSAPIQFLDGDQVQCQQAELTTELLGHRFRGPYLVVESAHGVLGRNILNLLHVTLDGPGLFWSA